MHACDRETDRQNYDSHDRPRIDTRTVKNLGQTKDSVRVRKIIGRTCYLQKSAGKIKNLREAYAKLEKNLQRLYQRVRKV